MPSAEKREFREAERTQASLLAPIEKKCLVWLAEHAPGWVSSDQLTVLGVVAMLLAGLSFWWAKSEPRALLLVIVCLALNWLGDSLDGTLARVRKRQRPRYGFYVDHVADTFNALFLLGGLSLSGYITPLVAWGLLLAYYIFSIEVYLATYTLGNFQISHWKFSPTELRILLSIGCIQAFRRPDVHLFGHDWLLFDVGCTIGMAGMLLMALAAAARHTLALYRAEPLR